MHLTLNVVVVERSQVWGPWETLRQTVLWGGRFVRRDIDSVNRPTAAGWFRPLRQRGQALLRDLRGKGRAIWLD